MRLRWETASQAGREPDGGSRRKAKGQKVRTRGSQGGPRGQYPEERLETRGATNREEKDNRKGDPERSSADEIWVERPDESETSKGVRCRHNGERVRTREPCASIKLDERPAQSGSSKRESSAKI